MATDYGKNAVKRPGRDAAGPHLSICPPDRGNARPRNRRSASFAESRRVQSRRIRLGSGGLAGICPDGPGVGWSPSAISRFPVRSTPGVEAHRRSGTAGHRAIGYLEDFLRRERCVLGGFAGRASPGVFVSGMLGRTGPSYGFGWAAHGSPSSRCGQSRRRTH